MPAIIFSPDDQRREVSWQGAGVALVTSTRAGDQGPPRVVIAVAEVLAAIVLAGLAWWCWHRGVHVTMRRGVALSRVEGSWWAAATGVAIIAGILLLDATRKVLFTPSEDRLA